MNSRNLLLVLVIILGACSRAEEVSPTPDIPAIVSATVSAQQTEFYEPVLQAPANGASFENPASIVLEWDWVRDLVEGEFYDVRVWREGEPDNGITWSSTNEFSLAEWLSQRDAGEFFWSVAVIEGNPDTNELVSVLGQAPDPRRFTVESNQLPTPTPEPTPAPFTIADMVVELPSGFTAEIYGRFLDAPTAITDAEFDSDGSFVALAIDGRIYRAEDTDSDGTLDSYNQILDSELNFEWAIGLAIYEDRIYISDQGRIGYIEDSNDDGIFDTYTTIFDNLPGRVYPLHSNNDILIYDDVIYVAVGSTTDHGPINHEYEAAILTMNLDGSDVAIFASGFRNPYALTMSSDGRLFTGDNSPDSLDASLPFYPPEELNYVREGRHYGFPYIYGNGYAIRGVDYPTELPVTQLVTSTATVGVAYYGESLFPEAYQDGVFLAQFGGMQRGLGVLFIPLEDAAGGNYQSNWQPFIQFNRGFEPIDLIVGSDGALYIVEWSNGHVIRVAYEDPE